MRNPNAKIVNDFFGDETKILRAYDKLHIEKSDPYLRFDSLTMELRDSRDSIIESQERSRKQYLADKEEYNEKRIRERKIERENRIKKDADESREILNKHLNLILKDKCERLERFYLIPPTMEQVNTLQLLNMRKSVSREEIRLLASAWVGNYQSLAALSDIAKTNLGYNFMLPKSLDIAMEELSHLEETFRTAIKIYDGDSRQYLNYGTDVAALLKGDISNEEWHNTEIFATILSADRDYIFNGSPLEVTPLAYLNQKFVEALDNKEFEKAKRIEVYRLNHYGSLYSADESVKRDIDTFANGNKVQDTRMDIIDKVEIASQETPESENDK